MVDQEQISALVQRLRPELRRLAQLFSSEKEWSLALPVGIIDAREEPPTLRTVAVSQLTTELRTSTSIGHPLMLKFLELAKERGEEEALEVLINGPEGEAFAEVWDEYVAERTEKGRAMWSLDDAAAFAAKSRDAFADEEVAIVAVLPGNDEAPHGIATFGLPQDWLLRA